MGQGSINLIIICVAFVFVGWIAKSYIAKGGHSDCCGTDSPVRAKGPKDKDLSHYSHTYTVKVNGMSCSNCVTTVTNAFNAMGDTLAEVDLESGVATVHTKAALNPAQLTRVVRNAGYGVGEITGE